MYECTTRCDTCGFDLATDYEAGDAHTETGLCHGVGRIHVGMYPSHAIRYLIEPMDDAEVWRLVQAATDEDRNARAAVELRERLRQRAARLRQQEKDTS